MKKCIYCAEEIQEEAIICRYCGNSQQSKQRKGKKGLYITGIVLFILTGLYGLILDLVTLNMYYGLTGIFVGLIASPLVVLAVPIYYVIQGYWAPLVIIYGGGIISGILMNKNQPDDESENEY